ncbi:MAG: S-layer homology domain-containing protein, partial [Defluviitaleaceae bacterium]|nr:S-layer homology domain-containing protein [Defluviitaleaceae bacterium]
TPPATIPNPPAGQPGHDPGTPSPLIPTGLISTSGTVNLSNLTFDQNGWGIATTLAAAPQHATAATFATRGQWHNQIFLQPNGQILVNPNTPAGTYNLQVDVTRGGVTIQAAFSLTVQAPQNQTLILYLVPLNETAGFEVFRQATGWVPHTERSYTITFTQGETWAQISNRIPQFRRQGLVFNNWRLNGHNGPVIAANQDFHNNMTIWANWTSATTVNITFNARGGSWAGVTGAVRPLQFTANQTLSQWQASNQGVAALTPVRTNYEFIGWFINETRDMVNPTVTHFTQATTLNARWRPIGTGISNITFNANGGTWRAGGTANRVYAVRNNSSLQSLGVLSWQAMDMEPTRTGFVFDGWRNTANQNIFNVNTNIGTANVTLEAIWRSTDQVNLIFNPNGGVWANGQTTTVTHRIGRGQSISSHFNQSLANFITPPTRVGFTFEGWYIGVVSQGNILFTNTTLINENTTVTARWAAVDTAPPWQGGNQGTVPPVTLPETITPTAFIDVSSNAWYHSYVNRVSSLGIFQGTGEAIFSPQINMNRAMFAQALANMNRLDITGLVSNFSDVSSNAWYSAPIAWAANAGIVQGTGYGQFSPNMNITREQIALMLFNYANYRGITLPTTGWTGGFADANSISPWASVAVEALNSAGVITGRPGGAFDPQANATRAEVAAMFARFANFVDFSGRPLIVTQPPQQTPPNNFMPILI